MPEAPDRTRWRRIARLAADAVVVATAVVLFLALAGRVVRDRTTVFALLMYLPMLPIAVATLIALMLAMARRRRVTSKPLIALVGMAVLAAGWNILDMTGRGSATIAPHDGSLVTLMQWNVQWGGREVRPQAWGPTASAIRGESVEIIVLNEAPAGERIARLCADLGQTWNFVSLGHAPRSRYWYGLAVASCWPVRLEREVELPNGAAMSVIVEMPQRPLRVLVVDGISNPRVLRTPMLHAVARHCREEAAAGWPVDLIAGDFNAVSASLGFDSLREQQFALASRAGRGWRGTFPSALPLYDIDHVWVSPVHRVASCRFISSSGTNHRGQIVEVDVR